MRPQVVSHRGTGDSVAEHTLGGYLKALEDGADALECDVRLTADGHLVCVHDRSMGRDTVGPQLISTLTLDQLDDTDLTALHRPWADLDDEAPERDEDGDRVLTLRRLMECVADHRTASGQRVELAVETKHPTRYAGLVERRVVELLRDFGWGREGSPARVMSFSYVALQRVRRLAPRVPVVMLVDHAHYWPFLRQVVGDDWIIGPGVEDLRDHPGLGRRLVEAGREIHVWTVNTRADVELCRSFGVSAYITDRPAFVRSLVDG
ncbi:glycerophosphodiester phosphodiesterase family protein [uncultured Nocardioides sp.]|uniref:glycerophosphodiester phosphodiesterase n=1 Tax=uncultured Nocardioides sp. TaxID=198441 RepID=UPI002638B64A|nr:glycerophosphodiester phosphodiesterase family protein [uncultured Nocardioides sp.]